MKKLTKSFLSDIESTVKLIDTINEKYQYNLVLGE